MHPVGLRVVEGPDAGLEISACPPPVRVGSAVGNELTLTDPTVSRHHFSISAGPDGLLLEDAGSTNGVLLGGHRVRAAIVEDGSRIHVGRTVLEVQLGDAQISSLSGASRFGDLLASSTQMQEFLQTLQRVAPTQVPILVEGETGTGKELTARALHEGSGCEGEFVVVDCGAAAPNLIESAFFGHARGAFTGAEVDRTGAFVAADGGTLFLDEIGELSLDLQPKLLRALEAKTVTPLGTTKPISFSTRVVAATHRDLRRMVNEGRFREDLYFRLAVCPVRIPPLRDRLEDVDLLARQFFREALGLLLEVPDPLPDLDVDTATWLRGRPWPGNARELRNVIQRAVILGRPQDVTRGALAPALRMATHDDRPAAGPRPGLEEAKKNFERTFLLDLLRRHQGDHKAAAEEAQLHVKSLQRLVRRYGLKDEIG